MKDEKKERGPANFLWLLPVGGFLLVGSLIAVAVMKDAASELAGRPQAGDLSSSGLAAAGAGAAGGAHEFFSSDETVDGEAMASYERYKLEVEDRLYEKGPSAGKVSAFAGAGGGGDAAAAAADGPSGPGSSAGGYGGPAPRLASGLSAGRGGRTGGPAKSSLGAAGASAFQSGSTKLAVSASGETGVKAGASKKGSGGVIEALRSAWRGSVMGARDASNDAARTLLARSFDGSSSSERLSLEYDEKMKKELDVVDPNSIPKFLRDQDISADRASAFDVPDVKKASVDREGTEKALAADKEYQAKKALASMNDGMLNSMFSGVANTNGPGAPAGGEDDAPLAPASYDDGGDDLGLMSSPDDQQWLEDLQNQEWTDMGNQGCGEECGCSCAAPCCCLPPATDNCPVYGPFLPDDPCGADFYAPQSGEAGIWV